MTEYQKQLKDPRWQKKRLEIMERDEWTCQRCKSQDATLTVHHRSYRQVDEKFVDVWDYANCFLVTLCESCHSLEEDGYKYLKRWSHVALRRDFLNVQEINLFMLSVKKLRENLGRRLTADDVATIDMDDAFQDALKATGGVDGY